MLRALIGAINSLFSLFYIVILIRCFLSFVPNLDWNRQPFYTIRMVTDSYLDIFKRFIPPIGMLDVSPIVAIIVLGLIQNIIIISLSLLAG